MAAADEGREPERLPRARRLTRGPEIRAVLGKGKRSRTRHLDVFDSASPLLRSRAGIVVPRYGRRIIERNRLKRRLREILRRRVLPGLEAAGLGIDVVVRTRREAYEAAFADLRNELMEWLDRRCQRGSSS